MEPLSVIVTAHNCATLIKRALDSVAHSLAFFRQAGGAYSDTPAEVIVVDDGSTDDTPGVVERFIAGRDGWRLVRRPRRSSPACARNTGVAQARGKILFFLDGDDLFLPPHIAECCRALEGPDFVKTGVRLADPVHPDWRPRIAFSLAINLCVRRHCHEAVGGFPDYHLFRRDGDDFRHELDVFFKFEDMAYNRLLDSRFRGRVIETDTVEYCRHLGNAYDRQYQKFRRPFGAWPESHSPEERLRLLLGDILVREYLPRPGQGRSQPAPQGEGDVTPGSVETLAGQGTLQTSGEIAAADRTNWQPHVVWYTDDSQWGGVAQYNHALLCALANRGYPVTCVQGRTDNALVRLQEQAGVRHSWLDYEPAFDVERMLHDSADAERRLEDLRPDLVVFSNGMPVSHLAARQVATQKGIPFVVVEGLATPDLADRHARCLDVVARQYAQARAVIAVSWDNLRCLRGRFGLPLGKGQVIYYGRPEEYFRHPDPQTRRRLRAECGIPDEAVLCFTAGRLHPLKGFQHQLAAIELLRHRPVWPKLYFAWAGSGQLEGHLCERIRQMGVEAPVKLLGQRDDVADWLGAADIFVLPSEAEGMPLAVMEAMAKGLPVAATAVNGIPEELGPTGKLLPAPKLDAHALVAGLAQTITAWAEDETLRRAAGDACRERARVFFREERMVQETLAVLEKAMLPPGDYVSPGLPIIRPDRCFPHMRAGDPRRHPWPYLRREVPHKWYVDQRFPSSGWLNRDEVHLLYHNARLLRGRRGLEIGCFLGWSTCHLALAGLELDVLDPLLARPEFAESVRDSLQAAGILPAVRLIAGHSPQQMEELAMHEGRRWSFFFIDGSHDGEAPLHDAQVCARFAEDDAMAVFHDLAAPDVARGLEWFLSQGWQVMIYQTMQVMGVAWRGAVRPVAHRPDPKVTWRLPEHLRAFPLSEPTPQP
jgi:glycosyltransferase involved in cell wall biosynthesis